jgi:hypothetical protein
VRQGVSRSSHHILGVGQLGWKPSSAMMTAPTTRSERLFTALSTKVTPPPAPEITLTQSNS